MWYSVLLLLPGVVALSEWTPSTYPNPKKGGYKECKMRSIASVCDPDEVLTEGERYRLNSDLTRLAQRTGEAGGTFCDRKGIEAVLVIIQEQATQQFADELSRLWNLDGQCQRTAIFLLCAGDRKLYYSGEKNTGIDPAEFQAVASAQEIPLRSGQYTMAMGNIFKELGKKSNPLTALQPPTTRGTTSLSLTLVLLAPLFLL